MFAFLAKLLPACFSPLGIAGILLVLAMVYKRRERMTRTVLGLALALLYLGGNRYVALALNRSLEGRYSPPQPIPQAEAIVLLGGGTNGWGAPRPLPEVNGAADRLFYAAWLYRQGKAPFILVSGGLLEWSPRESTPAQDMATLLRELGVPAEAIRQQGRSRNTAEDALQCARLLQEQGIHRILLVTSAFHMPRAVNLFRARGLEVIPAPADYTVSDDEWRALWSPQLQLWLLSLVPQADYLALTSRVLREYLGLLVYALRGWR